MGVCVCEHVCGVCVCVSEREGERVFVWERGSVGEWVKEGGGVCV